MEVDASYINGVLGLDLAPQDISRLLRRWGARRGAGCSGAGRRWGRRAAPPQQRTRCTKGARPQPAPRGGAPRVNRPPALAPLPPSPPPRSMQLDAQPSSRGGGGLAVRVPPTRSDILHACDVMEDVAISYGYNNLQQQVRRGPGGGAGTGCVAAALSRWFCRRQQGRGACARACEACLAPAAADTPRPPLHWQLPSAYTAGRELPLNQLTELLRGEAAMAGYTEVLTWWVPPQRGGRGAAAAWARRRGRAPSLLWHSKPAFLHPRPRTAPLSLPRTRGPAPPSPPPPPGAGRCAPTAKSLQRCAWRSRQRAARWRWATRQRRSLRFAGRRCCPR
jgi:hypothetical protein